MIKSKLTHRSGSEDLRKLNPIHRKRATETGHEVVLFFGVFFTFFDSNSFFQLFSFRLNFVKLV